MEPQPKTSEAEFNPAQIKEQLESALPEMITEMADLLEQPVFHVSKRDKRRMQHDLYWGVDMFVPHVEKLQKITGDASRLSEGFQILEQMLRKYLLRAKIRIGRNESAFDRFVKESEKLIKAPYQLNRLKQFRMTREGIQTLVRTAMTVPGDLKTAGDLIEESGRKHLKEYLRFANTVDSRLNSYRNVDFTKVTARNVTRVSDLYRDLAAAFENRLRLLVGLNCIAIGKPKTYSELRTLGYNELLQAVASPNNPLLHFLRGAVNRHVRNALSHAGVSSRLSKGLVVFVDYAPRKKIETEIVWTLPQFIRETKKLFLTILGAAYVENEFMYARTYCMVTAMKDMMKSQSVRV